MLSQFVNQMDEYLSNMPFKHRWLSSAWIAYMTISPPLSRAYPLWKRSQAELRSLRLFNLSPEELAQKIAAYWKKPRWQRWFACFGMNKQIDVWNYYQCCLAYQAVRPEKLTSRNIILANKNELFLNKLGLFLHQVNSQFEAYLVQRCRHLKWNGQHFLSAIKDYKRRLKKTFLTKLNKLLKQVKTEGERSVLKQQAEQEYQQIEALMLRYYYQWLSDFFSHKTQATAVPGLGIDVVQETNSVNSADNNRLGYSQTVFSPSQLTFAKHAPTQQGIDSLYGAKQWIQAQREQLNWLLEEGCLQKVEQLFQASLKEIKIITEFYLKNCDDLLAHIQDQQEIYDIFLDYLNNLQCRLKPLLQGGMLLFHPDHVMNLMHSQTMSELITQYSQAYLQQSRYYLRRLNNYHLRIQGFYQHTQQTLPKQSADQDWSDLAYRIHQLGQTVKDLEQSFKEFNERLNEHEANLAKDKEALAAKQMQVKTALAAKQMQVKTALAVKQMQFKTNLAQLEAALAAKRMQFKTNLAPFKAELEEKITDFTDFINSQAALSTVAVPEDPLQETSHAHVFKH